MSSYIAGMSHIFISYATADRDRVRPLVNALSERGWSVWWDRTILAGQRWEDVIEEALNGAQCVIVVWSTASVHSEWVRAEADEGRRRGVLVPVLLDDEKIPLAFRGIQAASLVGWNGSAASPEFDELAKAVSDILGSTAAKGSEGDLESHTSVESTPKSLPERNISRTRAATIAGAVLVAVLAGSAWYKFHDRSSEARNRPDKPLADGSVQGDVLRSGLDALLEKYAGYLKGSGFASLGPLPTISLTSKGDLNSYYEPATQRIVIDEALARSPFVGLREYTHYILFTTRQDASADQTGLESGLADYFPSSFSNQSDYGRDAWELFRKRYPGITVERNLQNQRSFGEIVPGKTEEHEAGTVWGGAFWQLRQSLGREAADKLLTSAWRSFDVRKLTAEFATFPRELVDQDAKLNRGRFERQIRDVFETRGLRL